MHRQPSITGKPRVALPSCVEDRIWREVDKTAKACDCSRSWVVAVALCTVMNLEIVYDYRKPVESKRKVRVLRKENKKRRAA